MVIGGLHPEQVGMVAFFQTPAFTRCALTITQQTLQKTKCRKTPSHAIRSTEQVGGSHPPSLQCGDEQALCQRLPLQISEQWLSHSGA